jgi:hypothetical protein
MLETGMAADETDDLETASAKSRRWLPFLWIVVASAAAHLWCLGSQFYMDDIVQIRDSEAIRSGVFWETPTLLWTKLGYVIQYRIFGMSPVGFHAVNWLLHTAAACVLFGLGRDFVRGKAPEGVALFGALLFAAHPLASEIPNYARTQDLAWVTLFSLLATWALLRFLRVGGWWKLLWMGLGIIGATLSKGPGLFHALMMAGSVGLVFAQQREHWALLRRRGWWVAALALLAGGALWISGVMPNLLHATRQWSEPRFIGHAYTLARVFWEFAWRAVIPVALCSDHHIAESLVPAGASWFGIPDKDAMWAAAGMLGLTFVSMALAWWKPTRLFGVCLFLFVATILFRVAYLIPEYMPEYRIYPGLPWFCLGAALLLGWIWKSGVRNLSPRVPAAMLIALLAFMSARRSFVWHDLDRLCANVLEQYPAQARAVWELHDRDIHNGDWRMIIDRQRMVWPKVLEAFLAENKRLAPRRELPSGHFALADVACKGRYAIALAHAESPAAGLAEIRRLELYMRQLGMDPVAHRIQWGYFHAAKAHVLEMAGAYEAALESMRVPGAFNIKPSDIERVEKKLARQTR